MWWPTFVLKAEPGSASGGGAGIVGGASPPATVRQATVTPDERIAPDESMTPLFGGGLGTSVAQTSSNGQLAPTYSGTPPFAAEQPAIQNPPSQLAQRQAAQPPTPPPLSTEYPTRGAAAIGADSPTLYPYSGRFVPPGSATVYPRGPVAPSGFRGQ